MDVLHVSIPPRFRLVSLFQDAIASFVVCWLLFVSPPLLADVVGIPKSFQEFSQQFCLDCHTGPDSEARLDLKLLVDADVSQRLSQWRRVIDVLGDRRMPPEDAEQPGAEERRTALATLRGSIDQLIQRAASDPGPSMLRRLSNAEYQYCIEDLTGVNLSIADQLVSDSVGGSGFTNAATGQFMQDATLERYLEIAKHVATHLQVGAGPLFFYDAPGQTGMELSAIERLQRLYAQHGFRAAAGEGAKPYGMDRFPVAFDVAWRFRYRDQIGQHDTTLDELAEQMDLEPKFAKHIWSVLNTDQPQFPLSEIVAAWRQWPSPNSMDGDWQPVIKEASRKLYELVENWQSRFAGSASSEDDAALLTDAEINVPTQVEFSARGLRKLLVHDDNFTPDVNDPSLYSRDGRVRFSISVEPASANVGSIATVIFSHPKVKFRRIDKIERDPVPLVTVVDPDKLKHLQFGKNPGGEPIDEDSFAVRVGQAQHVEVELPYGCQVVEFDVSARLDTTVSRDAVVRCTIADVTDVDGRRYSTLLRDPNSTTADQWESGLEEFAAALPQISHREPAPSDRDPIPAPYDNKYNTAERNYFHTAVKYYRDDRFLIQNMVSDEVAAEIDRAWTDLLTSFDYHDVNLRFVFKKFGLSTRDVSVDRLSDQQIAALPPNVARFATDYRNEFMAMQSALHSAQSQHLDDLLRLARRAWRRDLSSDQQASLREFYQHLRTESQLAHADAIRATLVRILMSPAFLYRLETAPAGDRPMPLDSYELASRLSFSIWSSVPDDALLNAARDGSLREDDVMVQQMRRMLASPKSRRLATEFFGQWLGFYQFDQYRGIDSQRFPEFNEQLKQALYDEAITFFEYLVRSDRAYTDIIDADYTFADQRIANHYGLDWRESADAPLERIPPLTDRSARSPKPPFTTPIPATPFAGNGSLQRIPVPTNRRGGVLGLGAILASTSAPLRTSPVKRGDWVLRRLIGTPVPPPPADAGSIPAEESLNDGKTVRERLEAHRYRAECSGCHVRIDPLGFALENFDPLGRWRTHYVDQKPINATGILASGDALSGLRGLKDHLHSRNHDVRRTLATKLVAYCLGRAETVYDTALIDQVVDRLGDDARFSVALETIILSPQFQLIRPATTPSHHRASKHGDTVKGTTP